MNSLDQQVLSQLVTWLQAGKRCWLCTIVETFGSSPRPVGSLLACNEDGNYCGSLSGGCVEDNLRESLFKGELAAERPVLMRYGVTVDDVLKLGLPCGGSLEVLIEPLGPTQAPLYADLAARVGRRELVSRTVDIPSGRTTLATASHHQRLLLRDGTMVHTHGPEFRLLLIGAVQVAWYLADMAQALGFHVEVCDPRAELVGNAPRGTVPVTAAMPDDWLRGKQLDQQTAVVALCHDPRIDDMALLEALPSQAFYVGAMGSARTSAKRRERLLDLDVTPEQLARLRAPVGLDLGSKTPPEIAIAILAELIRLRAPLRGDAGVKGASHYRVGCIVLAAGEGRRFGSDKRQALLAPGETVLQRTLANAAPVFADRLLVLRPGDDALSARHGDTWQIVVAPDAGSGMGHSLAAALPAAADWDAAVIILGDMPWVRPDTLARLRQAAMPDTLVVPVHQGQRGNPAGIGRRWFGTLAAPRGDRGARELFRNQPEHVVEVAVEDEGILRDVDTPEGLGRGESGNVG